MKVLRFTVGFVCSGILPVSAVPKEEEGPVWELDPYTVTGTRIKGIEVETTLPVVRLSHDFIDGTGYAQLGDALRSLPFVAGISLDGIEEGVDFIQGASSANLRGLGAELVLVDGMRIPAHDGGGDVYNPYNLHTIPTSAIGEVEILRDGASAIYGSDAISGVINIRTIRSFEGTRVSLRTGIEEGTESWEYEGMVQHGELLGEKGRLVLALDYYERNNLAMREHSFLASSDFRDMGGMNYSSELTYPASIGVLATNHPLFMQFATFPGPTDDPDPDKLVRAPQFFPANEQSLYFVDGGFDTNAWSDYRGDQKHAGTWIHLDQQLTDFTRGFLEFSYRYSRSLIAIPPTPYRAEPGKESVSDFVLPAGNPFNPFGIAQSGYGTSMDLPYLKGRIIEAGPRYMETLTRTPRLLAGLEGRAMSTWSWRASALWSESSTRKNSMNLIDSERFQEALDGVDLDGDGIRQRDEYFNPFGPNDPALINFMKVETASEGESVLFMLDAHASGDIHTTETLQIRGSAGSEYREETIGYFPDPLEAANRIISRVPFSASEAGREVTSVYGEMGIACSAWLELLIAGRFDHYSDFGTEAVPKISGSIRVFPELMLRGSYGEGFTAPSLPQLHTPLLSRYQFYGGADSKTGQAVGSFILVSGGNPHLEPSTSENVSLGMILEPLSRLAGSLERWSRFSGLTLGVDYFDIDYVNRIDMPSMAFLLANEDQLDALFPEQDVRIQRAEPLPGQTLGRISTIHNRFVNQSGSRRQVVDVWLEWPVSLDSWGHISLRADYSHILSWKEEDMDFVDLGYRPQVQWNASMNWSGRHWSSTAYFTYVEGLPAHPMFPGSELDASFRIHLRLSYEGIRHARLTVGARNLLNKDPSFDFNSISGTSPLHPREKRFWYLQVERNW